MNKGIAPIIALLIAIVILGGGIGGYVYFKNKPVVCPPDTKQCPDGSYVSRVPPKCEFQECPVVASTTTPTSTTGISDWRTYRDENLGFEIKYPSDWEIKEFDIALQTSWKEYHDYMKSIKRSEEEISKAYNWMKKTEYLGMRLGLFSPSIPPVEITTPSGTWWVPGGFETTGNIRLYANPEKLSFTEWFEFAKRCWFYPNQPIGCCCIDSPGLLDDRPIKIIKVSGVDAAEIDREGDIGDTGGMHCGHTSYIFIPHGDKVYELLFISSWPYKENGCEYKEANSKMHDEVVSKIVKSFKFLNP